MFIIDASSRKNTTFKLVKVVDITETAKRTPDGKWFVAYRALRNKTMKLNESRWKRLKEVGVTIDKVQNRKGPSSKELSALLEMFQNNHKHPR